MTADRPGPGWPGPGPYLIGVDLGTGGPKVALTTVDGRVLGFEAEKVELLLTPGGGAEQDPDQWWAAITTATRRLLARDLVPVDEVAGICVGAQWGGLVPVDATGRPLRNALIWMDSRGAAYSQEITGGPLAIPGAGYDARRLREWLRKTGGAPTRTGKDPVGQTHWLRHHEPDVYAASAYLLDVPEFLTMRLSGRAVAGTDTATLPRAPASTSTSSPSSCRRPAWSGRCIPRRPRSSACRPPSRW